MQKLTKIKEIIRFLEEKAPLQWQESFDNCGLQVGDTEQNTIGVLTALDFSLTVLEEAVQKNCNLIIAHHPLILKHPLKQISPDTAVGQLIFYAIEHRLCLYAMHTNLDKAPFGVSNIIAKRLGLINLSILLPDTLNPHTGLGMTGELKKNQTFEHFLNHLKKELHLNGLKYKKNHDRPVSKIAVCGGSGAFLIGQAELQQADVLVTGDLKYHDYLEAATSLNLVDIGHFESEVLVKDIIFNMVSKNFSNFATSKSEKEFSLIRYY